MKCHKVTIKLFCAISCLVIGNQELELTTNIWRRYSWLWLQAGIKLFYRLFYDAMFFFCLLPVFIRRSDQLKTRGVTAVMVISDWCILDQSFAQCKGIQIPESKKSLPVESGILGFGIWNTA